MKILRYIFLICLVTGVFVACQNTDTKVVVPISSVAGHAQGTTYTIKYIDTAGRDIQPQIDSILKAIDFAVSTYDTNSIISQFNSADSCMVINNHVLDLFLMSDEVFESTNGAFDPTIKPLVNLWGFGDNPVNTDTLFTAVDSAAIRDSLLLSFRDSVIDQQLFNVGWYLMLLDGDILYNNIGDMFNEELVDNYICKEEPGVKISFDAVAQGYSADIIGDFLVYKLGISSFIIEIGGEILCQGRKPNGDNWLVQIENPDVNDPDAKMGVANVEMSKFRAVAVSGNYRSYKELSGKKYGHCIDPRTGYPAKSNIVSAAVFSNDCGIADAYATAFMVMGIDEAVPFVEGHPFEGIEAFFVYYNQEGTLETYVSSGLEDYISL